MKKGSKFKRRNRGCSLASRDSEDLVKMTHKGLDKCASLLAHLMADDHFDDKREEKEKHPLPGKTKESKIKQKRNKQSNQQKVKKKVPDEQEEKRLRTKVDTDKHKPTGVVKELSQRTSYHPELVCSTPQSKLQSATPSQQTGRQPGVIQLQDVPNQLEVQGYCYEGSEPVSYPSSHGFNPGLIGGQMIPERETPNTYDDTYKHVQDVKASLVLPGGHLVAPGREGANRFHDDGKTFSSKEGKIWGKIYNTDQQIITGPDLCRNPSLHSEQDQGIAGYSLYSEDRDITIPAVDTRQSSTLPMDGIHAAKTVLRDLVCTLKSINERDSVSLDTISKRLPEIERFDHDNNVPQTDCMDYLENVLKDAHEIRRTAEDGKGQARGYNHLMRQTMNSAKQEEQQSETIISSDNQSREPQILRLDLKNSLIRDQVIQENTAAEELKGDSKGKLTQRNDEGEERLVTNPETENESRNDQNSRERRSPEKMRRKSPEAKKRKKKTADELNGRSCQFRDKKPLLEQQRVLRYLVTELKAVTEGKASIEVDSLFHSVLDTIDNLPFLTMDSEVQTEIAMALQPLRSENASLRRKLRIANQQMKELQRRIDGSVDERIPQSSESVSSTVKALYATLQEQLTSEQEECSTLKSLVKKLQDDLKAAEKKHDDLVKDNKHKDECHLRSQRDWMSEMATLRKQQICSKQELETMKWKMETLKKENYYLQNNLTETRQSLEKADQTTQWLRVMLARLAPSKDGSGLTGLHMTTREENSLKTGQSELNIAKTSPKRKRETEELTEIISSLKVKRDEAPRDDRERLDESMKKKYSPSFVDSTYTKPGDKEVRPSGGIDHFFGGRRKYLINQGGVDNNGSFSSDNEQEIRRLSFFKEKRLDEDYYDKFHQKAAHDKASSHQRSKMSDRQNVLRSESHNAIQLCDKENTPSGKYPIVKGQVGCFDVTGSYGLRHSTSNTFNRDQSLICNTTSRVTHPVISVQNPLLQSRSTSAVFDLDSCASDSTSSTVTSLFEVQFQLGLSNLDEKISKLQENLQNLKGCESS